MVKVEFECRKCKKIASLEQYKNRRFCLKCGTLLNIRLLPKHWLFQFNPSMYKWFERIKESRAPEQWLVCQYSKLIRKNDLVAIWSSGQKAGVYALGQIMTNPAKSPLNPDQKNFFVNINGISKFQEKFSAYVEYSEVFLEKPLLQEKCRQDKVLLDMQVFMTPRGTNFRLTSEQWNRIEELMIK